MDAVMGTYEELKRRILELEGKIEKNKVEPISSEDIDKICTEIFDDKGDF